MKRFIKIFGILIGSIIGFILISGFVLFQAIANPHIYLNMSYSFMQMDKLCLAELTTKRGIKKNTIKNLRKVHGDLSAKDLEMQLNMEYGHLYSQYSWIKYKKKELKEAEYYIQKALQHKKLSFQLSPVDWIRSGIIHYKIGKKQIGWDNIIKALIEDANIENSDPDINAEINHIVKERVDLKTSLDEYLEKIRYENAEMLPDLPVIIADTIETTLHDFIEEVLMIIFFSPTCGSCRQELQGINKVNKPKDKGVRYIFILNQPHKLRQANQLLRSYNYENPTLARLNNINAYDLIKAEPTTWIVNNQGKIIYKHTGYKQGDEKIYLNEIEKLRKF